MFRGVIIEDEFNARETLKELLLQYCKNITLVGEAADVKSGVRCIRENNPDIVFLDIEMPDGDGFEILRQLDKINFNIIFTTAYSEFALQAIKVSAIDYLLKPIVPQELIEAVLKAKSGLQNKEIEDKVEKLFASLSRKNNHKKLVLSTNTTLTVVNICEIIMCKSDRNYTQFFMEDGNEITVTKTLKYFDDVLSENGFIRPHNQYMVNGDHIKSFEKVRGNVLKLTHDLEVPVSFRKKEMIIELMQQM